MKLQVGFCFLLYERPPPRKRLHKDKGEKSQIYAEAYETDRHSFCQKYHIVNTGFQLNFPQALVKFPGRIGKIWISWGQDSIYFSVLFLLWIDSTFGILTKCGTFPPADQILSHWAKVQHFLIKDSESTHAPSCHCYGYLYLTSWNLKLSVLSVSLSVLPFLV